jgi:hypothetical protein
MNTMGTRHLTRAVLFAAFAAASAAVWLGYQRPGFTVWLTNGMWLCT